MGKCSLSLTCTRWNQCCFNVGRSASMEIGCCKCRDLLNSCFGSNIVAGMASLGIRLCKCREMLECKHGDVLFGAPALL